MPISEGIASEQEAERFAELPTSRALAPRVRNSAVYLLSSHGGGDGLWRYQEGRFEEIWSGSETALLEPAAVSPDGHSVALLLRGDKGWHLNVLSANGAVKRVLSEEIEARGSADWSPDGKWIVTGGSHDGVPGLFKIPVDGGAAVRLADGEALNPIWSKRDLIVYAGEQVNIVTPLRAVDPLGNPVELPHLDVSPGASARGSCRMVPASSSCVVRGSPTTSGCST